MLETPVPFQTHSQALLGLDSTWMDHLRTPDATGTDSDSAAA